MRKWWIIFSVLTSILLLTIPNLHAQKKLAQTGFQFLSVGTDARATAMGEAFTTVDGTSSALFYNPAGLAGMKKMVDISFNTMEWIADIQYSSGTFAFNPQSGKFGVFGISFMTIDYGTFEWTKVADNQQGFEDIGTELGNPEPRAYLGGIGYANQLTDRFAVGGHVKYVYQYLGNSFIPIYTKTDTTMRLKKYSKDVIAFDFGTIYKTGFKSLEFGMTVRNFSEEVKYEREGFQLPLTFKIGFSIDAFDFLPKATKDHSLLLSIDAVHPRSFSEYLNLGAEYSFKDLLFLRAGYITAQDEYGLTTGVGFNLFGIGFDYSYVPFDAFDNIRRISARFLL